MGIRTLRDDPQKEKEESKESDDEASSPGVPSVDNSSIKESLAHQIEQGQDTGKKKNTKAKALKVGRSSSALQGQDKQKEKKKGDRPSDDIVLEDYDDEGMTPKMSNKYMVKEVTDAASKKKQPIKSKKSKEMAKKEALAQKRPRTNIS